MRETHYSMAKTQDRARWSYCKQNGVGDYKAFEADENYHCWAETAESEARSVRTRGTESLKDIMVGEEGRGGSSDRGCK